MTEQLYNELFTDFWRITLVSIVAGNVSQIDQARVVGLLENHRDEKLWEKRREFLNRVGFGEGDCLLAEIGDDSTELQQLSQELKISTTQINGWDLPNIKQIIQNEKKPLKKVKAAFDSVKNYNIQSENPKNLDKHFAVLIKAEKCLQKTPKKEEEITEILTKKDQEKYHQLIDHYASIVNKWKSATKQKIIRTTFSDRQTHLINTIPQSKGRKIVIFMGRIHGDQTRSSQYQNEVSRLIDSLKKEQFIFVTLQKSF